MAKSDPGAVLAFNRFGLGATPGRRMEIARDAKGACLAEVTPASATIPDASLLNTARAIQMVTQGDQRRRDIQKAQKDMQQEQRAGNDGKIVPPPAPAAAQMPKPEDIQLNEIFNAEIKARFAHGYAQRVGFGARWVMFWSNHFCVSARRGRLIRGVAGAYEREAIRPHVFGTFADLVVAAETHPAMLMSLDQQQSIGPNSPAGQRQQKGLNENLAREIMELHTLGVHGGYRQSDVTNFAKVLTGWTLAPQEEQLDGLGRTVFAPNRHEPGPQTILGKLYAQPDNGQAIAALRDFAAHPATARFIAMKLAQHFIADAPPPALIGRLEQVFLKTRGDLAALARSLLEAPESWQMPMKKLRTPAEFILASLRATGEAPENIGQINNSLNLLGQPLWNPPAPNGYPDDEASLAAPKAFKTRLELALQFSRPLGGRIDARALAEDLFGEALSAETRTTIARAESRPQGLALLLMSPEFQRR